MDIVVPLSLPICSVIRTVVRDSLCAPLFCEFRVRDCGLCSLPPLRVVGAKPERPCNLLDGHTRYIGVMGPNRAVMRVALPMHLLDDIRRPLRYVIYEAQNVGARASRFTRGICTSPHSPSLSRHWPCQTSTMNPPDILEQLHYLDKASPQFHKHLSNFLRSEEYRSTVPSLQGEDLAWLVEYLDSVSLQIVSP